MNIWRLTTMNLHELLRRLRAGESRNAIARAMHISPNTVKDYRRWAEAQQLLSGPLPDLTNLEALRAQTFRADRAPCHPTESSLEGYRAEVTELLSHGRQPLSIWRILKGRYPETFGASPSAVYRLVRSVRASQPPEVTLRIETAPGEVAQVDFGYLGALRDDLTGELRKGWVFVMSLGWSRHMYAEIVFDQTLSTLRQAQGRLWRPASSSPPARTGSSRRSTRRRPTGTANLSPSMAIHPMSRRPGSAWPGSATSRRPTTPPSPRPPRS
jgi:hypothetical protein